MDKEEPVVLTDEDKKLIWDFLASIYSPAQMQEWEINNLVAEIVEDMVRWLDDHCNAAVDFVPRPHGITKPGLTYLRKQIEKAIRRISSRNLLNQSYFICKNAMKYNYLPLIRTAANRSI